MAFLPIIIFSSVLAEFYPFDNAHAPSSKELHVLYTFFVDSGAVVTFHDMQITSSRTEGTNSTGVQLSFVDFNVFWKGIDQKLFCCAPPFDEKSVCEEENTLVFRAPTALKASPEFTMPLATLKTTSFTIPKAGAYLLVTSNCGSMDKVTYSGKVEVRNTYGYLPALDKPTRQFYGFLTAFYACAATLWIILSIRWRKRLFTIHKYILAVIALGLLECMARCLFLSDWNARGYRDKTLFVSVTCSSAVKYLCANIVLLVASLGLGVTRGSLGKKHWNYVLILTCSGALFDIAYDLVLAFHHAYSLSFVFVVLCMIPGAAINGGIFCWVFTALASLIKKLKDENQPEKQSVFRSIWKILIVAVTVGTVAKLFHTVSVSRSIAYRWEIQWIFTDGATSGIFFLVLCAVMYHWIPHENSDRFAYSKQLVNVEDDDGLEFGADDEEHDEWTANVLGLEDSGSEEDAH